MSGETVECDTCDRDVDREEAIRREPLADLDPAKWQALCCPDCGQKLKTVFVGPD